MLHESNLGTQTSPIRPTSFPWCQTMPAPPNGQGQLYNHTPADLHRLPTLSLPADYELPRIRAPYLGIPRST